MRVDRSQLTDDRCHKAVESGLTEVGNLQMKDGKGRRLKAAESWQTKVFR